MVLDGPFSLDSISESGEYVNPKGKGATGKVGTIVDMEVICLVQGEEPGGEYARSIYRLLEMQ
jgi:hypothetical protein